MSYERRVTPIHKSLHEIKTYGGVEDRLAILNGTIAAVIVWGLGMIVYLPISVALHFLLRHMTQKDPFLRKIYMRYNRQFDAYDPWPHKIVRNNKRPEGFGRGMLC